MVPVLVAVKVNLCLFVLINFYVFKYQCLTTGVVV